MILHNVFDSWLAHWEIYDNKTYTKDVWDKETMPTAHFTQTTMTNTMSNLKFILVHSEHTCRLSIERNGNVVFLDYIVQV